MRGWRRGQGAPGEEPLPGAAGRERSRWDAFVLALVPYRLIRFQRFGESPAPVALRKGVWLVAAVTREGVCALGFFFFSPQVQVPTFT